MMRVVGKALLLLFVLINAISGEGHEGHDMDKVTAVSYTYMDMASEGYLATPEGEGPFAAVLIIPGMPSSGTELYSEEKSRAAMIAETWGWAAFVVDIYRGGNVTMPTVDDMTAHMDRALEVVLGLGNVDSDRVAMFGYSSQAVMAYALNGLGNNVKALVSFHGEMFQPETIVEVQPNLLVLSGGESSPTQDIMDLEMLLDSANATWEMTRYSGVGNDFTVHSSMSYNEFADMRSWRSAFDFTRKSFSNEYLSAQPQSSDSVMAVDYNGTDGTALRGWLAMPSSGWARPVPAVVILPDWDGVNDYEKDRAVALAELGYVAFAADIYGADKQFVAEISDRVQLTGLYRSNPELFISRINQAIDQVKMLDADVMPEEIAVIGYCFGGTGTVLHALRNGTAKASVAFHGSFNGFEVVEAPVAPYLLVLSGGDDGLHGNQTIMEDAFKTGGSSWEITRYSGVGHGFTVFGGGAYDSRADDRSWGSMLTLFQGAMPIPAISDDMPTMAPAVPGATTMPQPTATPMPQPTTMAPTADGAAGFGMATALVFALFSLFFF